MSARNDFGKVIIAEMESKSQGRMESDTLTLETKGSAYVEFVSFKRESVDYLCQLTATALSIPYTEICSVINMK